MPDAPESAPKPDDLISKATKGLTALAIGCLIAGTLVHNLYLGTIGAPIGDMPQTRHLAVGALFVLFAAATVVPIRTFISTSFVEDPTSRRIVQGIVRTALVFYVPWYGIVWSLASLTTANPDQIAWRVPPPQLGDFPRQAGRDLLASFALFVFVGALLAVLIALAVATELGIRWIGRLLRKGSAPATKSAPTPSASASPKSAWELPALIGLFLVMMLSFSFFYFLNRSGFADLLLPLRSEMWLQYLVAPPVLFLIVSTYLGVTAAAYEVPIQDVDGKRIESLVVLASKRAALSAGGSFLVVAVLAPYVLVIYPQLPASVGGGRPSLVRLGFKDEKEASSAPVLLIDQTSERILFLEARPDGGTLLVARAPPERVEFVSTAASDASLASPEPDGGQR